MGGWGSTGINVEPRGAGAALPRRRDHPRSRLRDGRATARSPRSGPTGRLSRRSAAPTGCRSPAGAASGATSTSAAAAARRWRSPATRRPTDPVCVQVAAARPARSDRRRLRRRRRRRPGLAALPGAGDRRRRVIWLLTLVDSGLTACRILFNIKRIVWLRTVRSHRLSRPRRPALRAQERMPLWKLWRSYFSFGLWMRSSARPKPAITTSMPSLSLISVVTGIEPPPPTKAASLPHSSVSAPCVFWNTGPEVSKATARAGAVLVELHRAVGRQPRPDVLAERRADLVRVLVEHQPERDLRHAPAPGSPS